jgi:predicted ATPase
VCHPPPEVSVRLLGGFAVISGGEPVHARWRLRKGRDLVKLLALAPGHRMHREQLMEALWPDSDPLAAANNLNQVVHAARSVLGAERIELKDQLLSLEAEVDVDQFERAVEQARKARTPTAYRAALMLYGGELLPENRYDDWALQRRAELDALHAELRADLPGLGPERPASALPLQASSFVGRERELRELGALLRGTRMLTLAGVGGAGKTRLALELARQSEHLHPDGAVLAELASVSEGRLVPNAVAASLEVNSLPGRSLVDAIAEHLAPRGLLLVLDNCEHLLTASAALCEGLLRAAPRLTIVATTREPLRVEGEVVFRVPSLAIPDPALDTPPKELLRYESVRLFSERGAAAVQGFEIDAGNARDVARICFRLDGLPLALELAAARLGALGTGTLAERLDDRFTLLRAGGRTAPTRQQTLLATLQWSHDLLLDEERLLLRRLSVFAGGFELPAVEAVCSGGALAREAVVDVLARLVEKSLVGTDQSGRDRRYSLLETVRLYAGEQLETAGERKAITAAHARWALAIAERGRDSPALDRETANLRAAHHVLPPTEELRYVVALLPFWLRRIDLGEAHRRLEDALAAAPERTELRIQALLGASAIDYRAGTLACGEVHAREGYEIAVGLQQPRTQWRALQRLGEIAVGRDDLAVAADLFGQARRLARRERWPAAEALSVSALGAVGWLTGDLERAEELLAESAKLLQLAVGTGESIQSPLNISEVRTGESPVQRIVFEETLQPFLEISCAQGIAYVLANEATIARLRGRHERAEQLLNEAGERFAQAADERGRATVLVRRAYLALSRASPHRAREQLERALVIRRSLGDRRGVGMALLGLAMVGLAIGEQDQAEQRLLEVCELFRRAGDRWGLVAALWRSADLALARDRLTDAWTTLQEARAAAEQTERRSWIAVTANLQAHVARLRGEEDRAVELAAQAHGIESVGEGPKPRGGGAQSGAKNRQRARKAGPGSTPRIARTRKRRQA